VRYSTVRDQAGDPKQRFAQGAADAAGDLVLFEGGVVSPAISQQAAAESVAKRRPEAEAGGPARLKQSPRYGCRNWLVANGSLSSAQDLQVPPHRCRV
jgi:hypothetical protein